MGCGKSSVGRCLSELLCCPYMDLDAVIEDAAGRKIAEIFSTDGEPAFRQMEYETLQKILPGTTDCSGTSGPEAVLSLGGGTVMTPGCAALVRENTLCIYLRASIDTLVCNLEGETGSRPMLSPAGGTASLRDRITELMALRASTYESIASLIIDTDGKSPSAIAAEILSRL